MVTAIVLVAALATPGTTLFGENVTVAPAGRPLADRFTSCVNGLFGSAEPSSSVKLTGVPRAPVSEPGVPVRVKSGGTAVAPVPVRAALCVPTPSTTVKEADSLPVIAGLKTMLTVHELPAARLVPHVFDPAMKSEAFVPAT